MWRRSTWFLGHQSDVKGPRGGVRGVIPTKELTDHPPLWTIKLEGSGDIRLTTKDEIKKHEISKIVAVG